MIHKINHLKLILHSKQITDYINSHHLIKKNSKANLSNLLIKYHHK